ncbi:hypothetical protein L596_010764 [Steinernema carpocapsae]|uniref:PIK helical domain-containing protein n=1 Tax=Steinernema carpocapsae TaxID=34508 RepID=A0A4V6A6Z6_STECR|nr:hypothetical protein L596_010764 [Steinernema carpocapsae]
MGLNDKNFDFIYNCDLDAPVQIKLCDLEGCLRSYGHEISRMDLTHIYATFAVYCHGRPVGRPVMSSYKDSSTKNDPSTTLKSWSEWITLPIMYSELSRDTFLFIVLWNVGMDAEPVYLAQAVKTLFSKHGVYREDYLHIRMHRTDSEKPDPFWKPADQLSRDAKFTTDPVRALEKKRKLYCSKMIDHVQWLDQITMTKIEQVKQAKKIEDKSLIMMIEMAKIQFKDLSYSIVYFDIEEDESLNASAPSNVDRELGYDNLCEIKHHALTRNARTDQSDRHLKPNSGARDALDTIIKPKLFQKWHCLMFMGVFVAMKSFLRKLACPAPKSCVMSVEQRDLIWKFRYYLQRDKKALTKFVRSVNWEEKDEVNQAVKIIKEWDPIDPVDALELLSPDFHNIHVRKYAVSRLEVAETDKILLYLPQLVQALRYDGDLTASYVQESLIAAQSIDENKTEKEQKDEENKDKKEASEEHKEQKKEEKKEEPKRVILKPQPQEMTSQIGSPYDLKGLLIHFACKDPIIANYLFWYLKVEVEINEKIEYSIAAMYSEVLENVLQALREGNATLEDSLRIWTISRDS